MKQQVTSYISSNKDELYSLCKFLYDNPEESYCEEKACNYISEFLEEKNFKVQKNFLDIKTSFFAKKGEGHPKICFVCEYDAIKDQGHVTGHNLLTTISVSSAIALGNIIDTVKSVSGTVIIIGCPGEYLGGTKSTMVRQGVFDDIDAVLTTHPNIFSAESGTSSAIIPLNIKFFGDSGLSFLNRGVYTSLDASLLTFSILNSLLKGFPKDVDINSILSNAGSTPLLLPTEADSKFYIRSKDMDIAKVAESKLREICLYVSKLMRVNYSISLYEPPNEELLTNITLNRLYSHNLKEAGIINMEGPKDTSAGLSLGCVSHKVPCIHPYVDIVHGANIEYGSIEFAKATISEYAFENAMKASASLCFTALDLLTNENLLSEVKDEFYHFKKDLY